METAVTTYQPKPSPVQAVQPTQQDKETWTLKEKILFSLLGVVVVGGTIYIGRKIILNKIANKEEFAKVVKSYQKLYNGNLIKDMSDELQTTEYNEMLQILAATPEKKGQ